MANRSPFGNLESTVYQPSISRNLFTDREARAEYARLRKVANRRIARLEKAGYGASAIMRRYGGGFESLRGASATAVRERLGDVAAFLEKKSSSVTGQRSARNKFIATMHSLGYTYINKDNVDRFGRFMEAAKRHYGNRNAFDSNQMYTLFDQSDQSAITPEAVAEDFDYWTENMDQMPMPQPEPEDYEIRPIKKAKQRKRR